MCILPPPTALHIKIITLSYLIIELLVNFISTVKTDIYVLSNSVFGEAAPSTWFGLGLPKKKNPSAVQLSLTPNPEPNQLEVLHTFQAPSCNRFIISLVYQVASNANLGVFFPFFPAVHTAPRPHAHSKKAFFYVCTIHTIQSTIMAKLKDR